ncbi:MAG: hypothetical protein D6734_10535 [Candidatus Schekmanbacteria bacterium]|nr:MAG: hypothetical protein D6734_10535 [Candidatus Schekmanbacteria bacterium]
MIFSKSSTSLRYFSILVFFFIFISFGCNRIPNKDLEKIEETINSSNYSLALNLLSNLEKRYNGNALLHYLKGYCYLKIGNDKKALDELKRTFEIRKNYSVMIGDVDMANFLAGNSNSSDSSFFKGAIRELDTIIRKNEGTEIEERIRYHKALIYLLKDEYEKSILELNKIVKNNIKSDYDAKALLKIGVITTENLQNEKEGLKIIRDAISAFPNNKDNLAEGLLWIAEYKIKRVEMLSNRIKSLEEFIDSWQGIKGFQEDIKEAVVQIGDDNKKKTKYTAEAEKDLNEVIQKFPGTNYSRRAEELLAKLNELNGKKV